MVSPSFMPRYILQSIEYRRWRNCQEQAVRRVLALATAISQQCVVCTFFGGGGRFLDRENGNYRLDNRAWQQERA